MASESESRKPVLECAANGPYLVKNLGLLRNAKGESIPTESVIALCRCGRSDNKPFCDGTHARIGFSGEKLSDGSKDARDSYVGKKITLHDNRAVCSHAGFCTDNLASVFRLRTEPWIDPDGAEAEAIVEAVRRCPSGALSYSIEDVEHRDPERNTGITVSKDGPYFITGGIELQDVPQGAGASTERCALCRCGESKNKPFCDGTHWDIEFKDGAD